MSTFWRPSETVFFGILLISELSFISGGLLFDLALHPEHVPFYLNTHPGFAEECKRNSSCELKPYLDQNMCWGHEEDCPIYKSYLVPDCDGNSKGWASSKREQLEMFYEQADFGYIKKRRSSMFPLCSPLENVEGASWLNCTAKLEYCRGANIRLDFRELTKRRDEMLRYKMDVLKPGQVAGFCKVDRMRLAEELEFMSALQSWSPELQHLVQSERLGKEQCDLVVDTPTYIMKIDAAVSMYHHFCDFLNLYASQHLNETGNAHHPGSFGRDKQVLIWENVPYRSNFQLMFQVFTDRPVWTLADVIGKRVCFRDLVLPLPPRMIFGLFYNTPLIPGCERSGLFHAFSRHVLHRLGIGSRTVVPDETVRVLWISRQSRHRRVLNEKQILQALRQIPDLEVVKASFSHAVDFEEQVRQVASSDVLVGMHGAGLTHMLLLPDWAAVYELYNCEDRHCYRDLARLRGLHYTTCQDTSKLQPQNKGEHPELGAHEKFTNYTLDVGEVVRQLKGAVAHVRSHPHFIRAQHTFRAKMRHFDDEL